MHFANEGIIIVERYGVLESALSSEPVSSLGACSCSLTRNGEGDKTWLSAGLF